MSEEKSQHLTFEDVQKAATAMLVSGITPSIRSIRRITGGRTETVGEHLESFNKKRDLEVAKIADQIGSSEIGKLLASEIQNVVDRRTGDINEICQRQSIQIEEYISILKESEEECSDRVRASETDCANRITTAEANASKLISEANTKVASYVEEIRLAEEEKEHAVAELAKVKMETGRAIESNAIAAQSQVEAAEAQAKTLIGAAKAEANSLVIAANKQTGKAEAETILLREQVSLLSISQAKSQLEKEQLTQTLLQLDTARDTIAELNTKKVQLEAQKESLEKDSNRLNTDLIEMKTQANELPRVQAQLIETTKSLSQANHDLSQSEREKDSLSRALAVSNSGKVND